MLITEVRSSEWSLSLDGLGEIVQGIADINQCLKILLLTRPGDDPFRPTFGCDVVSFLDSPVNIAIPNLKKSILDAVSEFETRIKITQITPKLSSDGGTVTFTIAWQLGDTVETGQIDITYGFN